MRLPFPASSDISPPSVRSALSNPNDRVGQAFLSCLRVAIIAIAICSIFHRPAFLGRIGFAAWVFSYALIFAVCAESFLYLVRQAIRGRAASLAITLFFLVLYLGACFDPLGAHFETLQQVGCALAQIEHHPDAGFNATCFLGYPTRQYYLSSLPSLIFGRSSLNMNMGGYLYFLLGSVTFAAGLLRYLGGDSRADISTALVLTVPPHWLWLNHSLVTFEQAGYPFCLGMLLVGVVLRWYCTRSIIDAHLTILALYYCAFSYTPTIATYLGALPVVAILARSRPHAREIYALLALNIVCFSSSLLYRSLDLYDRARGIPWELTIDAMHKLARQIVYQDIALRNWSPEFHPVFVGFMMLCLAGLLGRTELALGAWVLATVVACVLAKGYVVWEFEDQYRTLRGLFRISVVLPVFSFMLAKQVTRFTKVIPYAHLAFLPWIALSLHYGMKFRSETREGRKPESRYILAEQINRGLNERHSVDIYADPGVHTELSESFIWRYYVPGFSAYRQLEDCKVLPAVPGRTMVFLLRHGSRCAFEARNAGQIENLHLIAQGRIEGTQGKTEYKLIDAWCRGCRADAGQSPLR